MRKKQSSKFKKDIALFLVIMLLAVLIGLYLSGLWNPFIKTYDSRINQPNLDTNNQNSVREDELNQEWQYYQNLLNLDERELNSILQQATYADKDSEIEQVLRNLDTQIRIYNSHINEAGLKLNTYSDVPLSSVYIEYLGSKQRGLQEMVNKINDAIKKYNSQPRCPSGYILGQDQKCHTPCGGSTTYCEDGAYCYNGNCIVCPDGTYLATDGHCYPT